MALNWYQIVMAIRSGSVPRRLDLSPPQQTVLLRYRDHVSSSWSRVQNSLSLALSQ